MASIYHDGADPADPEETEEATNALDYQSLMQAENIVPMLGDDKLSEISQMVLDEYEMDERSRAPWLEKNTKSIELAMMVADKKDFPFKNASNVKYPLVATAALQFNARAYPAICPPDRVVKGKTYGKDEDGQKAARAERVSEHMSWQLSAQMPEWEEDTDRLTLVTPITGCAFRKVFYDPALKRNVTRLVTAERLVYNYWARSFNDLPRLTEIMSLYPNEVQERINDGRFVDFGYDDLPKGGEDDPANPKATADKTDNDGPKVFLEQHRLLDLDGDDYPEPYVVTVHKASGKVCRIKANWTADTAVIGQGPDGGIKVISLRKVNYFVRYLFLPSPDGGAYGLGFGWLLADTNESINTTLNQMFDAGSLSNMQGGFISASLGNGVRDKTVRLERGEWRIVNVTGPLNQAMMPLKYDGPSAVLFSLLEFLVSSGKELAAIKDVLTGETPATAPVGTTLALIEQGLQVFTSIYKRIHRSLREELRLLADLNKTNVSQEDYAKFHDQPDADPAADYDENDMDVLPVSDPQSVTKSQKIAKAQAIYSIAQNDPMVDHYEALKRMLEAIDSEEIDKLLPKPQPPDPEQEALAKRAAVAQVEGLEAQNEDKIATATQKLAAAIKAIADAEGVEAGNQLGMYAQIVDMLKTEHSMENDIAGQGRVPGMAGQPNDAGSVPPAGIAGGSGNAIPDGGATQPSDVQPGGMGGSPAPAGIPQGAL